MPTCKASEIPRNEAYQKCAAVRRDEGNAADGHFPTASKSFFLPSLNQIGFGHFKGHTILFNGIFGLPRRHPLSLFYK